MKWVYPHTFFIGHTTVDVEGLKAYLKHTEQEEFMVAYEAAEKSGLKPEEILISFYAKLCYKSLVMGHNDNLTQIRDVRDNITGCISTGHGAIFEHVQFNFVTTGCSRVLTHELVRHRVGMAYSQTSGRYCRLDKLEMVSDPILGSGTVKEEVEKLMSTLQDTYADLVRITGLDNPSLPFSTKKRITSALRRIAPNGQANEIGWSCNLRALRHLLMMRTSRHAEREIRVVFNDVYRIIKERYPLLVSDAKEETVGDLLEITGMRMQQYDKSIDEYGLDQLLAAAAKKAPSRTTA